jgi:hypothetical protein
MPHCRAKATPEANSTVAVDNGITLTEQSSVNIDTAKPLAKAALEAGSIVELDASAAPKYAGLPANESTV